MLSPDQLESLDYKILRLVNKLGPMSESTIVQKMQSDTDSVKLRLSLLSTPSRHPSKPEPLPNSCYLNKIWIATRDAEGATIYQYSGMMEITPLGIKALEDLKARKFAKIQKTFINSVLLPIGVSIITTLLTILITKYLGIYL